MEPRQNKPRSNQRGKTQAAKQGKRTGAQKPASGGAENLTTTVMLGTGMSQDFSNAVGDQVRSSQRLGK